MNSISLHWRFARGYTVLAALGLFGCGFSWSQAADSKIHPDTSGWKNLFAADLSNAIVGANAWHVEDGVLSAKDHSTIWTKDSYSDFVLDLEFKVAKESNSGVFFRAGNIKDVLSAFEIQVHETTDGGRIGMVGALYDAKAPSKSLAKPVGEWNRYTITCKGSLMTLVFNGEVALDLDLDDWKQAGRNPDGTRNKFSKALKDYSRKGPIGFQGLHGAAEAPVWYRNLKIKSLE
ncbi:MAG: DUF1080 domain-containing protein [Verrucomicrobia bacterium]|nr:DUF1080 domain-containing protein [Verrucomicrobiota bacterium]